MKIPVKFLKISGAGLVSLALLEGFSGGAYRDTVGVWTLGFGETKGVTATSTTTPPKAMKRFIVSVDDEHGRGMKKCMGNIELEQHQYDAFLSFTYNIGVAGFCQSVTLQYLKQGKINEACKAMSGWYKPKEIIGRRNKEIALCLGESDAFQP